jgi:hypothetical protein
MDDIALPQECALIFSRHKWKCETIFGARRKRKRWHAKHATECLRAFRNVRRKGVHVMTRAPKVICERIDRGHNAVDNGTIDFGEDRDLHETMWITRITERITFFAFLRLNSDSSCGTLSRNTSCAAARVPHTSTEN